MLTIGDGISQSYTIPAGTSLAPGQVTVGQNSGGNGTLDLFGTLSSSGPYDDIAVGADSIGTVLVDGTGALWDSAGQIGVGVDGNGTLTVSNNGSVDAVDEIDVGENAGSNGTLLIESGGQATSSGTYDAIGGNASTASGTATVTGANSSWTINSEFAVGNDGTGDLTISSGGVVTVNAPTTNPEVLIGASVGSTGTVEIDAGSTLQVIGPYQSTFSAFVIGSSGTGDVTVTGTNALLDAGGNGLEIGAAVVSSGTLEVLNHATVDTGDQDSLSGPSALTIGRSGDGTVVVDGAGSSLNTDGGINVGRAGTGTLIVRNGGVLNVGTDSLGNTYVYIGEGNGTADVGIGGMGTAEITSYGSVISDGNFVVGGDGVNGAMLVDNYGSVLAEGRLRIGDGTTIDGTVYTGNGSVEVGSYGTIQVLGNNITESGTSGIVIGTIAGDTGTLDVSGTGALVNAGSQYITIGRAGQGVLAISNGGSVESGTTQSANPAAAIGAQAGGSGTLTITGPNSTYTADGQINIGATGQATVTISAGGALITGNNSLVPGEGLAIAMQSGSSGTVTVTDSGSEILNTGRFVVGGSGQSGSPTGGIGALTIENGALVQTNLPMSGYTGDGADIADDPGTGGSEVTVTGTNSTWMISSSLVIGQGANGTLNVANAGTVSTGGSLFVADGSIMLSGGTILSTQLGLASSTDELTGSGVVSLSVGLSDNGIVSSATGTLSVAGGIDGTGSLAIGANSELLIENAATVTAADFNGNDGILTIGTLADFNTPIDNFQQTDTIDVQDIIANNYTYDTSIGQLTLESGTTPVGTLTVPGISDPSLISLKPDGGTGTDIYLACFAPETRIATPNGPKQVQDLQPGDQVRTVSGAIETISWIGYRTLDLTRHPDPARAQPIRIRRSAFAPALPRSDLRLSPDHALFIDGMLIPARLLVNNATITQETDCTHITYFHIELAHHDILLAEGLPAESYFDTGNRGMFENADAPLILHPDFAQDRREQESCAPFVTDPARVEPIWKRLNDRAGEFGYADTLPATTDDPEFRIETAGRTVNPVSTDNGRYSFILPPGTTSVRLVSRSAKPNQTKPWIEDRRTLGLMIGRIALRRGSQIRPIALDAPSLAEGWWNLERDATSLWRWTDGSAEIPVPPGTHALDITVAGTVPYPLTQPAPDRIAA